jgi:calcineurin-like phosphoesterase family protein
MSDYVDRLREPFVIKTQEAADRFYELLEEAENHKSTPEEIKERKRKSKELSKMMENGERLLKSMWGPNDIYMIADTHFGHFNIIEYENRPFLTAEEMDEYMIEQWNETVEPHDTVLHLGDFFLTNTKRQIEIMKRLNGKIILIRGNHDGQSRTKLVERLGFKAVYDSFTLMIDDFTFILTHRPMELSIEDEFYFDSHNIINIHGHTHGIKEEKSKFHKCVSAENFLLKPVKLKRLIKFIEGDKYERKN